MSYTIIEPDYVLNPTDSPTFFLTPSIEPANPNVVFYYSFYQGVTEPIVNMVTGEVTVDLNVPGTLQVNIDALLNGVFLASKSIFIYIRATQNLTFNDMYKTYGDASFIPSVSTNRPSLTNLTFSIGSSSVARTIDNATKIEILTRGSVTIQAHAAADNYYTSATATATLYVTGLTQQFSFLSPVSIPQNSPTFNIKSKMQLISNAEQGLLAQSVTYNFEELNSNLFISLGNGNFAVSNSASVGVQVDFSFTATGTDYYEPVTQFAVHRFTVLVTNPFQTITFSNLNKLITDSVFNLNDLVSTNATGATFTYTSSDTAVAQIINSNQVQINGLGTTTLTATGSETANYAQTQKTATLTVSKPSQIITFNNLNKLTTDSTFSLTTLVSTNAAGATFTYTSSDTAVAQIINGNQVQINGAGVTTLTATGSETANYAQTQKTATLTVSVPPLPGWKRSKLNLYDFATKSLHLKINQEDSSIQFEFPTNLTFSDTNNSRNISDVIDYLQRVAIIESDIDLLETRTSINDADIDLLETRISVNEADIDGLEGRASTNETDLLTLKNREESNTSRLLADDAQMDIVESDIDTLKGRASAIEADIDALKGRADVNESNLVVLDERADSNASRLLADDAQMDIVESDIDALEGRASINEADINALEGRADVNESDLVVLEERADSNASRLLADDAQLDVMEIDIDVLEGRMSTAETDIVELENSFTNYEADVVEIKGTLYAITDGNIESMLSSLHEIADSFASETNAAEDMTELNARLAELESVIQELTNS